MRPDINNFIKVKLEEISSKFSNVEFLYEYSAKYEVHLLQVEPLEDLENEKLMGELLNLESDFVELFPFDTVYIVRGDSLLKVSNPTFSKCRYTPFEDLAYIPKWFSLVEPTISVKSSPDALEPITSADLDKYAMAA